jgi:type VI secretion system secreted protein Hcp
MQDFNFSMYVNKASPKLFLACAKGTHIGEAMLTCRKAGDKPHEYLKIKFTELLVSSFQTGGSAGDVTPVENISLNFAKIEVTYTPQDNKGAAGSPVIHSYNAATNEAA